MISNTVGWSDLMRFLSHTFSQLFSKTQVPMSSVFVLDLSVLYLPIIVFDWICVPAVLRNHKKAKINIFRLISSGKSHCHSDWSEKLNSKSFTENCTERFAKRILVCYRAETSIGLQNNLKFDKKVLLENHDDPFLKSQEMYELRIGPYIVEKIITKVI